MYNYSLHKPRHYKRAFELANHTVFWRDKSKVIVPNSTSKNHINPRAIDVLKKELKIKKILIFDILQVPIIRQTRYQYWKYHKCQL